MVQRAQYCFGARQGCFVSSTQKTFRALDAVECFNVFLSAGNNPGVLSWFLNKEQNKYRSVVK